MGKSSPFATIRCLCVGEVLVRVTIATKNQDTCRCTNNKGSDNSGTPASAGKSVCTETRKINNNNGANIYNICNMRVSGCMSTCMDPGCIVSEWKLT